MVLILSLEQHVAVEVEDALPPVVRLEHLDELLACQLIPSTRAHDCSRMLVRSRHMEVSQLSVPKNLDEEPWLGELGAAHDALEIVE